MSIILILLGLFVGAIILLVFGKWLVYGHIPGLSLLQFVSNPNQLAERSAEYGRGINKLVKIDTPVISFVLATHPDSAKVPAELKFLQSTNSCFF
jgi:hypothetical protein